MASGVITTKTGYVLKVSDKTFGTALGVFDAKSGELTLIPDPYKFKSAAEGATAAEVEVNKALVAKQEAEEAYADA